MNIIGHSGKLSNGRWMRSEKQLKARTLILGIRALFVKESCISCCYNLVTLYSLPSYHRCFDLSPLNLWPPGFCFSTGNTIIGWRRIPLIWSQSVQSICCYHTRIIIFCISRGCSVVILLQIPTVSTLFVVYS
jgi:hypothetical protein